MRQRRAAHVVAPGDAEDVRAHLAHRAGDSLAVSVELRPGRVARWRAVACDPLEQLVQHRRGHVVHPHRAVQLAEHWPGRPVVERIAQQTTVRVEPHRRHGRRGGRRHVDEIVGDATERVQGVRGSSLVGVQEVTRQPESARMSPHDPSALCCVVHAHPLAVDVESRSGVGSAHALASTTQRLRTTFVPARGLRVALSQYPRRRRSPG